MLIAVGTTIGLLTFTTRCLLTFTHLFVAPGPFAYALPAGTILGSLCFGTGTLLVILRRRSQAARIAELEAIVEARRERDGSR